jgi:hypothetical protein
MKKCCSLSVFGEKTVFGYNLRDADATEIFARIAGQMREQGYNQTGGQS